MKSFRFPQIKGRESINVKFTKGSTFFFVFLDQQVIHNVSIPKDTIIYTGGLSIPKDSNVISLPTIKINKLIGDIYFKSIQKQLKNAKHTETKETSLRTNFQQVDKKKETRHSPTLFD